MIKVNNTIIKSPLWLGTASYPNLDVMIQAIQQSQTDLITVSIQKQQCHINQSGAFMRQLQRLHCQLLPNTAGCRTAKEAIHCAHIAREIFETDHIKLEVVGDDYSLHPDPYGLVDAARELVNAGFTVFPYCTDDIIVCQRLLDVGCHLLMPWAAPIGSAQGIRNPAGLRALREHFHDVTLIVDAGIGSPTHAAAVMEMGFDGVLMNTAIARARDPIAMAQAFQLAVKAGKTAYAAGIVMPRETALSATNLANTPYWKQPYYDKSP